MEAPRVLLIDDESHIRRVVRHTVEQAGAEVIEARTARDGIDMAVSEQPDLIILDLGLPDGSGMMVCREIRSWSSVPIIILSAHHTDSEKIALLDAGADDYLTKPFNPAELQARLRAQLRRSVDRRRADGEVPVIATDGLRIDLARRVIERGAAEIHLTPIEWDLLRALTKNAGRTLTHSQIFNIVWPNSAGDAQAYLRVHVSNLRRKLEQDAIRPRVIITEPGVGYRFRVE